MNKILSYLAPAAVVLLASCSSEPSDWRADKKVSLDMVAPGTRPSDNFDQATDAAPNQAKGAAITTPTNSAVTLDKRAAPTAGAVMSADTQEGTAQKPEDTKPSEKEHPSAKMETGTGQTAARVTTWLGQFTKAKINLASLLHN